jgi:hypothetical protein
VATIRVDSKSLIYLKLGRGEDFGRDIAASQAKSGADLEPMTSLGDRLASLDGDCLKAMLNIRSSYSPSDSDNDPTSRANGPNRRTDSIWHYECLSVTREGEVNR